MPPTHLSPSAKPASGRYLSFAEREDIALLSVQGQGVRAIARKLGRAASSTEPRPRSGMLIVQHVVQSLRSWP